MSECALLDSFWGATGFFNIVMQRFAAALLHKVVLSMQNNEDSRRKTDSLPAPRFVKEC